MSILSLLQEGVCPVIGLAVPESVYGSTLREHVELRAVAMEMAQRIAFDTHDWSRLKAVAELPGDGAKTLFDLPADYRRMLKKARIWQSRTPYSPLTHYPDSDQWLGMSVQSFQPTIGGWTIVGDQIGIKPVVAAGGTVTFPYLRTTFVKAADGTRKAAFTTDSDTFVIDERLLRLGIIWQWRANKGLAYAEDMATYEEALASLIGADKGSNILTVGRGSRMTADTIAYPGVLGR